MYESSSEGSASREEDHGAADPGAMPVARGGLQVFAQKLYDLLQSENYTDTIAWSNSGLSVKVKDEKRFATEVVPVYFQHSKYASFQRQLNLYGFKKVTRGDEAGCYMHPSFQRGRPQLLCNVRRRVKSRAKSALARARHHRSSQPASGGDRGQPASSTPPARGRGNTRPPSRSASGTAPDSRGAISRGAAAGPPPAARKREGGNTPSHRASARAAVRAHPVESAVAAAAAAAAVTVLTPAPAPAPVPALVAAVPLPGDPVVEELPAPKSVSSEGPPVGWRRCGMPLSRCGAGPGERRGESGVVKAPVSPVSLTAADQVLPLSPTIKAEAESRPPKELGPTSPGTGCARSWLQLLPEDMLPGGGGSAGGAGGGMLVAARGLCSPLESAPGLRLSHGGAGGGGPGSLTPPGGCPHGSSHWHGGMPLGDLHGWREYGKLWHPEEPELPPQTVALAAAAAVAAATAPVAAPAATVVSVPPPPPPVSCRPLLTPLPSLQGTGPESVVAAAATAAAALPPTGPAIPDLPLYSLDAVSKPAEIWQDYPVCGLFGDAGSDAPALACDGGGGGGGGSQGGGMPAAGGALSGEPQPVQKRHKSTQTPADLSRETPLDCDD